MAAGASAEEELNASKESRTDPYTPFCLARLRSGRHLHSCLFVVLCGC
jgi:hypothetical protein